jgi:GNAT superfamily N-acetyltransferase
MKYNIITLDKQYTQDIQEHLKRLDKNDRYMRFFAVLNDSAIEHFVKKINFDDGRAFGVFDKSALIGFAQLAGIGIENGKKTAEFAISIDKDRRGSGLARQLMKRCVNFCKANSIEILFMSCLRENDKMKNLARAEGLKVIANHEEAIAELNLENVPIERGIAVAKEFAYEQISILDKCYRFNNTIIKALIGQK